MVDYRETSTMISDFVLALVSYVAGTYRMNKLREYSWRHATLSWFAMFGFSFIGFAAIVGFVRFGYFFPKRQYLIKGWHHYFTDLASVIGLPMLAAAYSQRTEWQNLCWFFFVLSILSTLLHCISLLRMPVRDFCACLAILFIIISSLFMEFQSQLNIYGLAGCGCVILSVLVNDQGRGIQGFKNVDLFHYIMAIGICFLAEGLLS
ncbi:uncharacterized protein LOC100213673 [Hydra vulgaris]|uniref:Uncharacterized protein LOC100213673 n=1 Tax=Hydra vulgaris TaxID=6087 RepID=A0ABM4DF26_HYDVU